jgi:hypothetical protein
MTIPSMMGSNSPYKTKITNLQIEQPFAESCGGLDTPALVTAVDLQVVSVSAVQPQNPVVRSRVQVLPEDLTQLDRLLDSRVSQLASPFQNKQGLFNLELNS